MDSAAIRKQIKAQRNALPADRVLESSVEIAHWIWRIPVMSRARRIACYFSVGGEIDCTFIIDEAWNRGRQVFLPVLSGSELSFARYVRNCGFLRNFHGIPEPIVKKSDLVEPREIDVVLAPLVAFDASGNRIGMGGGYYDRSFRFLRERNTYKKPTLIGLAHDFQNVPKIKASSWDIPLEYVVTERKVYRF